MARINLLPWRERRREQQRKEFLAVLGGVAAAGFGVVVLVHLLISGQIDYQTQRNEYLRGEISKLDRQVAEIKDLQARRNQLIDRMKVIQDLQGTRPVIVRVFDEIVRTLPDGVYYKSIQSAGNKINIVGTAESNNRVSSLMRKLEASDWFANPILKGVKANPSFGEQGNDFELSIDVTMPGKTDESAEG
jgi:type IV pilus assembly protein PilN